MMMLVDDLSRGRESYRIEVISATMLAPTL